MSTKISLQLAISMALCAIGSVTAQIAGEPFDLVRSTFPAGVGQSAGGEFELFATVGPLQTTSAGGGEFELTGGALVEAPPGDCAYDGAVSLGDFSQMVECVAGPGGLPPSDACRCFDLDPDDAVDLRDVAVFQRAITSP